MRPHGVLKWYFEIYSGVIYHEEHEILVFLRILRG